MEDKGVHRYKLYEDVIELGPRKIGKTSGWPVIYLPKEFVSLHKRKVMVTIKLLPEPEKENKT